MRHDFLIDRLIPDDSRSLWQGAVDVLGPIAKIGRWRRHIYKGVANSIEKDVGLPEETLLKTPWRDLPEAAQQQFLYGTGDRHITFAWRSPGGVWKHGGTYDGLVADLLGKLPQSQEHHAPPAARKIHGVRRLHRVRRNAAQCAGPQRPHHVEQRPLCGGGKTGCR